MASEVTLLPEPDSPTIPSTCLGWRSKLTPRTAWTMPSSVGNSTRQVPDLEHRPAGGAGGRLVGEGGRHQARTRVWVGSKASRRPSPMKLMVRAMITMIRPGK